MKKVTLIFLFSFVLCNIYGQESIDSIKGVYLKDCDFFKQDITKYWLSKFKNGVAKISKGGFYGLIDTTGAIVVPIKYDEINFFYTNYILLRLNGYQTIKDFHLNNIPLSHYGYDTMHSEKIYVPELKRKFFRYQFWSGLLKIHSDDLWSLGSRVGYIDTVGRIKIPFTKYERGTEFYNGFASVRHNGFWGAINTKGEEVVKPYYDHIGIFNDGLAKVMMDTLFGFVNTMGKIILPVEYVYVSDFSEGLAVVKKDGKFGFVNTKGETVIDFIFTKAQTFSYGLAKVEINGEEGYIDKNGKFVIGPEKNLSKVYSKGRVTSVKEGSFWVLVDCEGNKIDSIKSYEPFHFDREGYASFSTFKQKGLVNKIGEKFQTKYSLFNEGLSKISTKEKKWGFVDRMGSVVIKPKYDMVISFYKGISGVKLNGKWGAINKKGGIVIPIEFIPKAQGLHFYDYENIIVSNREKYGVINSKCDTILPFSYDVIYRTENKKDFKVGMGGKFGFCSEKGITIIPPLYEKLQIIDEEYIVAFKDRLISIFGYKGNLIKEINANRGWERGDEVIVFEFNDKWGFYNLRTSYYCKPKFDRLNYLTFPVYAEKLGYLPAKYGYLDSLGNYLTKPLFDNAKNFKEGMGRIAIDRKFGFVNTKGELVIATIYNEATDFFEGLALVRKNDFYGYINKKGERVLKIEYEEATRFSEGLACVKVNGKWGYIDKEGKIIIEPKFDSKGYFINGQALGVINKRQVTINKRGSYTH